MRKVDFLDWHSFFVCRLLVGVSDCRVLDTDDCLPYSQALIIRDFSVQKKYY